MSVFVGLTVQIWPELWTQEDRDLFLIKFLIIMLFSSLSLLQEEEIFCLGYQKDNEVVIMIFWNFKGFW